MSKKIEGWQLVFLGIWV